MSRLAVFWYYLLSHLSIPASGCSQDSCNRPFLISTAGLTRIHCQDRSLSFLYWCDVRCIPVLCVIPWSFRAYIWSYFFDVLDLHLSESLWSLCHANLTSAPPCGACLAPSGEFPWYRVVLWGRALSLNPGAGSVSETVQRAARSLPSPRAPEPSRREVSGLVTCAEHRPVRRGTRLPLSSSAVNELCCAKLSAHQLAQCRTHCRAQLFSCVLVIVIR